MALTERTRPYELLIRFHQNGEGAPTIAAHQLRIHEILQNGAVISATELPAEPLDPTLVADLVGEQLPTLIAERNALTSSLSAMTSAKEVAAAERDAVTAARDAPQTELTALKASLAEAVPAEEDA